MNLIERQSFSDNSKIPIGNIISYWQLENNANDSVGLNHGFETNMSYSAGLVSQQGNFNGVNSYITINDVNQLSFGNGVTDSAFSISLIARWDSVTAGILFSKAQASAPREYYLLYNSVVNELRFRVFSGGTSTIYKSVNFAFTPIVGQDYIITCVYDGVNVKLWVYSNSVGTLSSAGTYVAMSNTSAKVMIGAYNDIAPMDVWSGKIDEVTVWNKALSIKEILAINRKYRASHHITGTLSPILPFGTIIDKTDFTDSSMFTAFGNGSKTLSGTFLSLTSSTDGVFTNGITYNKNTGIQKFRITVKIKIINALNTTKYGVGLGSKTINAVTLNSNLYQLAMAGANTGSRTYYSQPNYTSIVSDTTSNLPMALNDIIEISFEQNVNIISFVCKNITQGVTRVNQYQHTMAGTFIPNVNNPAIHLLGGVFEMQQFKLESNEFKGAKLMCIGDSKTQGYYATDFETTYVAQLNQNYNGIVNNSGGGDETTNVLQKIQEIIDFVPKKVLLNIGSNDKRRGRTFATWQANYDSIVSQLITAGIDVYHLLQFNETSLTFTDYNTHITSTYPSGKIVNAGTIGLNADGVHPNQSGMNTIYSAIVAQIGSLIT